MEGFQKNLAERHITQLNDEMIEDILSRLPPKDVVKSKILNNNWNEIISSDYFTKELNVPQNYKNNRVGFIMKKFGPRQRGYEPVVYENGSIVRTNHNRRVTDKDNNMVIADADEYINILGCCGYLVCLSNREKGIYFWNPTTNENFKVSIPTTINFPIGTNKA